MFGSTPTDLATSAGVTSRAYGIMRVVEDAHWWFDAMETISVRMLDRGGRKEIGEVLDAGCGTGRNLRFLERRYPQAQVVGLDFSPVALTHCRERGCERLVRGSVDALPFATSTFDLVTSFDVLTAGSVNEVAALQEFARVLRPGGRLLVRVAAYDFLRSRHDAEWNIRRRYQRGELRTKLAQTGLRVLVSSYANTWLFSVALAKRWLEAVFPPKAGTSDLLIGTRVRLIARTLRALLRSEAPFVAAGLLPCGLSLLALAEKSEKASFESPDQPIR